MSFLKPTVNVTASSRLGVTCTSRETLSCLLKHLFLSYVLKSKNHHVVHLWCNTYFDFHYIFLCKKWMFRVSRNMND